MMVIHAQSSIKTRAGGTGRDAKRTDATRTSPLAIIILHNLFQR